MKRAALSLVLILTLGFSVASLARSAWAHHVGRVAVRSPALIVRSPAVVIVRRAPFGHHPIFIHRRFVRVPVVVSAPFLGAPAPAFVFPSWCWAWNGLAWGWNPACPAPAQGRPTR